MLIQWLSLLNIRYLILINIKSANFDILKQLRSTSYIKCTYDLALMFHKAGSKLVIIYDLVIFLVINYY